MKLIYLLPVFILAILFFCTHRGHDIPQQPETPKALQDKSGGSFFSKRGGEDLVESLYYELADKTPELKALESSIEKLGNDKVDSSELFNKYNSKNNSYYNSTDRHIALIQDSVLREKIKQLISNCLLKYNNKISLHSSLQDAISKKETTLSDLHSALKLIKTLPLIEKYQTDNLPAAKPLQNINKEFDRLIIRIDSLTQK